MKITKSQVSAIIVFTVSLILFGMNFPEIGFLGLIAGVLFLMN